MILYVSRYEKIFRRFLVDYMAIIPLVQPQGYGTNAPIAV